MKMLQRPPVKSLPPADIISTAAFADDFKTMTLTAMPDGRIAFADHPYFQVSDALGSCPVHCKVLSMAAQQAIPSSAMKVLLTRLHSLMHKHETLMTTACSA